MTSHDVVLLARRRLAPPPGAHTRAPRVGHGGTLDPFATGLLVLLVGRATRLLPYLDAEPKVYDAVIRFGAETDTDDPTGRIVREAPVPRDDALSTAIGLLTGTIDQVPPAYSAKKVGGRRAYAAARTGAPLDLAPARVVVHAWTLRERGGAFARASIVCSGGTYIRALARDLGRLSGSAAHLESLRRVRSGCFAVERARPISDFDVGPLDLLSPRAAVPSMPVRALNDVERRRIVQGRPIDADADADADAPRVALVDALGELIAIAERVEAGLQPRVVLGNE